MSMVSKSFKKVYQFKIRLLDIKPPIWRRIQVPESYTFFELHAAIQAAMGWNCYHLHEFQIVHPKTGKEARIVTDPDEEAFDSFSFEQGFKRITEKQDLTEEQKNIFLHMHKMIMENREPVFDERKEKISDWFSTDNNVAIYIYDFGDWFEHEVKLEKILPRENNTHYPNCIAGKRACPPEDCGGPGAYMEFIQMLKDPQSRDIELMHWYGEDFDPEYFDLKTVNSDRFKRYLRSCV